MHEISLITTISFGLTAALGLGLGAKRIGLSPIVGYLLAGIVVGPHTPGFVGDINLAKQLAEIGVILLMFGVGLHFHVKDLLAVRSIAVPGAIGQSITATIMGLLIAVAMGWSNSSGVVLGIAVSVASTVVLLRALDDQGLLETTEGKVAVGWLVVEDILTVLVLVLLPALAIPSGSTTENTATFSSLALSAGFALLKLVGFALILSLLGTRFVPWLLLKVAVLRSRELFTLTILVVAMAIATIGYLIFGASMALGAFLAGMVVGHSKLSHQAAADALPFRDAFAVLFFVAVGMLFNWHLIIEAPLLILGIVFVTIVVKPLTAFGIVVFSRHTLRTGIVVAAGLGQIGEFSFIVAESAKHLGLMTDAGYGALVASAIVSISLNPFLFRGMLSLESWIERNPTIRLWFDQRVKGNTHLEADQSIPEHTNTDASATAIVVGYGPVGKEVVRKVESFGLQTHIIDMNPETILSLHAEGKQATFGDASKADILTQSGIKRSTYLIITVPDTRIAQAVIARAQLLNPNLLIISRARYINEGPKLNDFGADVICSDEAEVANALTVIVSSELRSKGHRQKLQSSSQSQQS